MVLARGSLKGARRNGAIFTGRIRLSGQNHHTAQRWARAISIFHDREAHFCTVERSDRDCAGRPRGVSAWMTGRPEKVEPRTLRDFVPGEREIGRIAATQTRDADVIWWGKLALLAPERQNPGVHEAAWVAGHRGFTQAPRHHAGEGDPANSRCPRPPEKPGHLPAGQHPNR